MSGSSPSHPVFGSVPLPTREAEGPAAVMIAVPVEAFGLLMAYCHTSAPEVPAHIKSHPGYPANNGHRTGGLLRVLKPYAAQAFAALQNAAPLGAAGEPEAALSATDEQP